MVLVTPAFIDEVLWPEYLEYSSLLQDLILEVVDTVIVKIEQGVPATPSSGDREIIAAIGDHK